MARKVQWSLGSVVDVPCLGSLYSSWQNDRGASFSALHYGGPQRGLKKKLGAERDGQTQCENPLIQKYLLQPRWP